MTLKPRRISKKPQCRFPNCTSYQCPGGLPFCQTHGGGKRCVYPHCHAVINHEGWHCRYHGGGVKCNIPGCKNLRIAKKVKICHDHRKKNFYL